MAAMAAYAATMSATATVRSAGVGAIKLAAYMLPTTWVDVAYVPFAPTTKPNPVIAAAEMGLVPTFPVTNDGGTLVTPVCDRMA